MPKPGDPDYEHVEGQMDVYDVLEEIGAPLFDEKSCSHVDPLQAECPFCGAKPTVAEIVRQRLQKGDTGEGTNQGE